MNLAAYLAVTQSTFQDVKAIRDTVRTSGVSPTGVGEVQVEAMSEPCTEVGVLQRLSFLSLPMSPL